MTTLHIKAVGDLRAPYLGADGVPVAGRYAGRARKTFAPLPDGEHVTAHADYHRAIARGDLALVTADLGAPLPAIDLGAPLPALATKTTKEPAK